MRLRPFDVIVTLAQFESRLIQKSQAGSYPVKDLLVKAVALYCFGKDKIILDPFGISDAIA